jgi:hypothetical protein
MLLTAAGKRVGVEGVFPCHLQLTVLYTIRNTLHILLLASGQL